MATPLPTKTRDGRTKPGVPIPDELRAALAADDEAWQRFDRMPPSHQRETVGYVAEAKLSETRTRRSARVVADLKTGRIGGG